MNLRIFHKKIQATKYLPGLQDPSTDSLFSLVLHPAQSARGFFSLLRTERLELPQPSLKKQHSPSSKSLELEALSILEQSCSSHICHAL